MPRPICNSEVSTGTFTIVNMFVRKLLRYFCEWSNFITVSYKNNFSLLLNSCFPKSVIISRWKKTIFIIQVFFFNCPDLYGNLNWNLKYSRYFFIESKFMKLCWISITHSFHLSSLFFLLILNLPSNVYF